MAKDPKGKKLFAPLSVPLFPLFFPRVRILSQFFDDATTLHLQHTIASFTKDTQKMKLISNQKILLSSSITMLFSLAARKTAGFTINRATAATATRAYGGSAMMFAKEGQAEVILVGCGAPNRGMGWYHAVQMLEDK